MIIEGKLRSATTLSPVAPSTLDADGDDDEGVPTSGSGPIEPLASGCIDGCAVPAEGDSPARLGVDRVLVGAEGTSAACAVGVSEWEAGESTDTGIGVRLRFDC